MHDRKMMDKGERIFKNRNVDELETVTDA